MSARPLRWTMAAGGLAALAYLALPEREAPPTAGPVHGGATAPRVTAQPGLALVAAGSTAPSTLDAPLAPDALLQHLLGPAPEAALPQLEALARRSPGEALPLYERLLSRWASQRQYPQAMLALSTAPLDDDTLHTLRQRLIDSWAEAAPDQATRWAQNMPGQAEWLAPLQDRWLQQDARSATIFASTLPPGEQRQALLNESLSRWTAQDGQAARDWLRSQGSRAELDEAIARHATGDEIGRYAPFDAMDLIGRMAVPERRWQAWQALAQTLQDIDHDRAVSLLSQAPGLTPAERARLIEELR